MKIYSKAYTAQAVANASPPLSVPAGSMTCFTIPFPSEGLLEKFIVYQASGTPVAFELELLNSVIPYPPGIYTSGATPADKLEPYRVQTPITAPIITNAGDVMTFTDDDFGTGFRNIDGGWTDNKRCLYLLINPQSAGGTTTWNVTIQCRTDIG